MHMDIINKIEQGLSMFVIVEWSFLVLAKMIGRLAVSIITKPRGVVGQALCNKSLSLVMELWSGKVFVD